MAEKWGWGGAGQCLIGFLSTAAVCGSSRSTEKMPIEREFVWGANCMKNLEELSMR